VLSSRYDEARHAIVTGTRFSPTTQFFASDRAPLGYDCDREPSWDRTGDWKARQLWSRAVERERGCPRKQHRVALSRGQLEPGAEARMSMCWDH